MLNYMHDKIYQCFKNDERYKKLEEDAVKYIYCDDYFKMIERYSNNNPIIHKLIEYIKNNVPEQYKQEIDICLSNDISSYESKFNDLTIEEKLSWLYEVDGGDMSSEKIRGRNKLYIKLYTNNVLINPKKYSDMFHCMYYFKVLQEKIYEMIATPKTLKNVQDFIIYESELFNKVITFSENETFKQIMYSKREQIYLMFYQYYGQFCYKDYKEVNKIIGNCFINVQFKYNDFTFFKLMFNSLAFHQCVDMNDIKSAKKYLDKIIMYLDYGYTSKEKAIKALNHYNDCFNVSFLHYSKFVYTNIQEFMPNLAKKWKFIENPKLSKFEKSYYLNQLKREEFEPFIRLFQLDNTYSLKWIISVKDILTEIDKLYA